MRACACERAPVYESVFYAYDNALSVSPGTAKSNCEIFRGFKILSLLIV